MSTKKPAQQSRPGLRLSRAAGPLRVSVVRYLNTAPLVWGLERETKRLQLSHTTPAACADDLRAGRADVGIIPAIEYQTIPGLKIIPQIAIASERKVESVLLVSRGPARLARRVALDQSSRTSVALVKVLFPRLWRREPEYVEAQPDLRAMLADADAALLIGDPALQFILRSAQRPFRVSPQGEPLPLGEDARDLHVYDLAEEWWRLTKLPFVFAFWAVRGECVRTPPECRRLVHTFMRARDEGLEHLPEIARQAAQELNLPGGQLERYLRTSIGYRLDAPQRAGLESFYRMAHEQGLLARVRPLEFL